MNKNTSIIGGIILLLVIGGIFYLLSSGKSNNPSTSLEGGAPKVTTSSSTALSANTATLSGIVDPNGAETTYWFEYSTDPSLAPMTLSTSDQKQVGVGVILESASSSISKLTSGTSYYFRIVAQNKYGVSRGESVLFKTK